MGERPDPADHNDYTTPQMVAPASVGHLVGSLSDVMTFPTDVPDYTHSSLFHRMYNLVHREWYRDESLQDPVILDLDDGPDDSTDYVLLRRGKRKDYFSGALPFAQKGDPVTLSFGLTAPLVGTLDIDGTGAPTFDTGGAARTLQGTGADSNAEFSGQLDDSDASWNVTNLEVDLSVAHADLTTATASTINDIRIAITMQHVLERDARGGTRYRESVFATFGVHTDDIRLLRPELLATGTMPIHVAPVAQTGPTVGFGTKLGSLSAFATGTHVGRGFVKTFTEHGMIMGIVSMRADLSYQQGLNRMFSRLTRLDHFDPQLQHLGEQAVISREIYTDGTGDAGATPPTGDFEIWGYQPRYEEYRHRQSVITGEFRSTFATSLDIWHLALDFATRPVLNAAFIEENPPVERILQLADVPDLILDCYFKIRAVRPMAMFATPGLDRF